jgi:hypothetical protein
MSCSSPVRAREAGEKKGVLKQQLEIPRRMKAMGDSVDKIAAVTRLLPETVQTL